jgi:hypothetical protein
MANIRQAREALITRILQGGGKTSHDERRAAFLNVGLAEPLRTLVSKIARRASTVTDDDIAKARASFSEDQLFEIIVCAAIGQAVRQHDVALAALSAAQQAE